MWVLGLQQLRITVIKENSIPLVVRHWRNVHNYSRQERKKIRIKKKYRMNLSISAVQVVCPPESLHRCLTQLLLLQQQLQEHHQLLWRHLPRQEAQMRLILPQHRLGQPTETHYWMLWKKKKLCKTRRGLQNHEASRIMCILLLFFLLPAHLLESAYSSQTIQFISLLMWLFQWRKWQRNKNRSWDGD